ncbi:MAG: hypothetical protein GTN36_03785 [Candidatus Aenigmarchaeota archaeon]|nr:hypothetical protein [Candidatus Aenigmarchaeota archaeon]
MKIDGLKWEYQPIENPDWDYARNLFTVLKRPQATWSQSIFSVRHKNLIAPNRDYRFQGLCAFVNKDYWKFLDAVFFGMKGFYLEPKKVIVFPWKSVYQYSGDGINVDVSYYLSRDMREGITAKIIFDIKNSFLKELIIKPLVDIRGIFSDSNPEQIKTKFNNNSLTASLGENKVSFFVNDSSILAEKEILDWRYKLGSGFRENTNNGIRFISEWARPVFIGEIHKRISGNEKVSLIINCNRRNEDFDENEEKLYIKQITKKFDCKKELLSRIISLDSFGILENNIIVPEAGDFWFRQIWLRDLLEALINNFQTFIKLDNKKINEIMKWILKKQDRKTGRFLNFKNNYNSVDTSLLFFILAEKYLKQFNDKTIEKRILQSFNLLFKKFSENKIEIDGPPVIRDYMLYSMPWHSWTDSKISFMGKMISTRIPRNWITEDNLEEMLKPSLLPEINAMFIRTLKLAEQLGKDIGDFYKKSVENYKKVFQNKDFLYSIIINDKRDPTETSMALISAVLLYNHVFNKKDLEKMWPSIQKLLVKKDEKLFGVLCRNLEDRIYFNDYQYHGTVVWPRDTPYLIKYLKIIGKNKLVKEILESNLDHQMNEAAIFYCNELFSLPEGRNINPTNTSNNPVPVKNPIQLWSHFCDDYLKA